MHLADLSYIRLPDGQCSGGGLPLRQTDAIEQDVQGSAAVCNSALLSQCIWFSCSVQQDMPDADADTARL